MIGEYGRYLEIMRAVRPDLDTARIAAALRSPAIVQVAWKSRSSRPAAHILAILETLQIVDIALGANAMRTIVFNASIGY